MDFRFLEHFAQEPVALLILGVITIIIVILKYTKIVDNWLERKNKLALQKLQHENNELSNENNALLKALSTTTNAMEISLREIAERQNSQGKYIRSVSIGTLENMLDNDKALIQNRLKAFIRLIGLARNSYNLKKGYKLITEYPNDFEYVYNEFFEDDFNDVEIIDRDYFAKIMSEISVSFYSGRLKCKI